MERLKPQTFSLRGGSLNESELEKKYGHLLKPVTEEEFRERMASKEPRKVRSRIITLECHNDGTLYFNISREPMPAGWHIVADCEHFQAQRFAHVVNTLKNNFGITFTPESMREFWMLLDEYHKRMSDITFNV